MTTIPDFKTLSVEELMAMEEKLQSYLQDRFQAQRQEALGKIQELVQAHDLSFDEVVQTVRAVAKRGKAPAIFRNPDNPRQTWSGKGEAPQWYTDATDKDALRIPGTEGIEIEVDAAA